MIDYARPYDTNMCDLYPAPPAAARLETFQVFRKPTSYVYGNYYSNLTYDPYIEQEADPSANIYQNLVTARECYREDWRYKIVIEWTEDDTVSWIIDVIQSMGFTDYDYYNLPYYNFRMPGYELSLLKKEDFIHRLSHPNVDPNLSRRVGDSIYEKLQNKLTEESYRQSTVFRYAESDSYSQEAVQTVLDLDSLDHKNRLCELDYKEAAPSDSGLLTTLATCDSSDDADDPFRHSETASPEYSYGSDRSKSEDQYVKRKKFKRPPGRPKGSGKKIAKRAKNISVPELIRNLLLDPRYCPSIIKWENHDEGKFRFVHPDKVAKVWGALRNNDNMTFEKLSRAIRYHYKSNVFQPVPETRLVYKFGKRGPDFSTDNPNFSKV